MNSKRCKPEGFVGVHIGAGQHSEARTALYLDICAAACQAAVEVLREGGSALDAAEKATIILEDAGETNAGFGSNLTESGTLEMDAGLMDGKTLLFGAVGAITEVKNPIRVARKLVDEQAKGLLPLGRVPPGFLVGEGARDWAIRHGIHTVSSEKLVSDKAVKLYKHYKKKLDAYKQSLEQNKRKKEEDVEAVVCKKFRVAAHKLTITEQVRSSDGASKMVDGSSLDLEENSQAMIAANRGIMMRADVQPSPMTGPTLSPGTGLKPHPAPPSLPHHVVTSPHPAGAPPLPLLTAPQPLPLLTAGKAPAAAVPVLVPERLVSAGGVLPPPSLMSDRTSSPHKQLPPQQAATASHSIGLPPATGYMLPQAHPSSLHPPPSSNPSALALPPSSLNLQEQLRLTPSNQQLLPTSMLRSRHHELALPAAKQQPLCGQLAKFAQRDHRTREDDGHHQVVVVDGGLDSSHSRIQAQVTSSRHRMAPGLAPAGRQSNSVDCTNLTSTKQSGEAPTSASCDGADEPPPAEGDEDGWTNFSDDGKACPAAAHPLHASNNHDSDHDSFDCDSGSSSEPNENGSLAGSCGGTGSSAVFAGFCEEESQDESQLECDDKVQDTVGVVVLDGDGNVAASVSSGGIALKQSGRVGQASCYGCGCWAQRQVKNTGSSVAVSTTGCGEHLVRTLLAKECGQGLANSNNPMDSLQTIMKEKFAESEFLEGINEKLGGAICMQFNKNSGLGTFLWTHTTSSMGIGFQSTGDEMATVKMSRLPKNSNIQGTTILVESVAFSSLPESTFKQ